ncbi:DUF5989 family protein [Methylocapsa polymorpha]|uniref:DUF5989 family protein n=1 Tax=Methylocapsa polymorpha TaxID=3080828 RepID=A0ABZ0HWX0_9HYPH|nr:DUF5989 family protein [Methylocapsa sp. RX1]
MSTIVELFNFLRSNNKLWLYPIIITMLIIGGLLLVSETSVVAPFIYALF